ncbi:MAG: serine/threonine protein kinase [Planctomycetes bacterium]|nr:serine/threonine protein kinase [Planctomycetota bacterium]
MTRDLTHKLTRAALLPVLLAGGARAAESGSEFRIGPYRIVAELGAGGMGTVYLAEQREPVVRQVALKVAHGDVDPADAPLLHAQFHVERQALALADHDHVVRLLDVGSTAEGRPWLAMEYVGGEPIDAYCDARALSIDARLGLFADVCAAVQHLHDRGIQHRDLKPQNVLVTERDGVPVPKIVDLGLAAVRGIGPREATVADALCGTLTHMAPEQLAWPARPVDHRADVFALGVLLHQLLVGALPFSGGDLQLDAAAPAPSRRLRAPDVDAEAVARARGVSVGALTRRLRGRLDRIATRAIAAEPSRRPPSAGELAAAVRADVERRVAWSARAWEALLVGVGALIGAAAALL